jgi:AcrR family transcriptional regulator
MPTVDHRRAVAERNRAAILDAAERLLARQTRLSMAAIAAEAKVSRPTLYAHFDTLTAVLEAAVERLVKQSLAAIEAAKPDTGPADAALMRMVEASWHQLAGFDAMARGAAEYLPAAHVHRTHAPLIELMTKLIERGQRDGSFRHDLPIPWLVTAYFALVHSADELARRPQASREDALANLKTTIRDLFHKPSGAW